MRVFWHSVLGKGYWRKVALILLPILCLLGCDPLTPRATPVVVVVTSVPSPTPFLSPTPAVPSVTPTIIATASLQGSSVATKSPRVTTLPEATEIVHGTQIVATEIAGAVTPEATGNAAASCKENSGQVIPIDKFPSAVARGENLRYRVYIPPCYLATQKRYPYVILIHGSSYKETQWETLGVTKALDQGIRLGALPPMILVMPYFGNIGNLNSFPPDPSYETVILDELVPAIERDFCTWNDRKHRAIGGISRGGFWAYSIALRHPDVFGIVGGHSPFFPTDNSEVPVAFNPIDLALNASFLPDAGLRMYLDNGAQDSAGPSVQLFSSRLSSRGIAHTYVINPVGEHDNAYWSAHVSEYLTFYGRTWSRNVGDLPSCLQPSP